MQDNEEYIIDQGQQIIDFIKQHPLISVNGLEKLAEMPKNTLTQAVRGTRKIPVGYWHKLHEILIDYGYNLGEETSKEDVLSLLDMHPQQYIDRLCIDIIKGQIHIDKREEDLIAVKSLIGLVDAHLDAAKITFSGSEVVFETHGVLTDKRAGKRK